MKKIPYIKSIDGAFVIVISNNVFQFSEMFAGPVAAINDSSALFDPESIVAIEQDEIVIAC